MTFNTPSEDEIRARAFELYRERGGQPGHEIDDWLQAEFELTHRPFRIAQLLPFRRRGNLSPRRRAPLSVRFSKH
ncbi:MAG TPA: DUF2934 domain-containing protein [Verrucomicrobiae bacterium]|nr:DUF2934 domain-containing protein [Verrucomicrobiae bacterium]